MVSDRSCMLPRSQERQVSEVVNRDNENQAGIPRQVVQD